MRVSRTGAAIVCAAVIAGLLGVAPAVASERPAPHASSTPPGPSTPDAHMGDYSAGRFAAQAEQLPGDLVAAVERDLGQTPEQYLAGAAAAVDGGQVVADLQADGVKVLSSRMDGTHLVVGVADAQGAAVARSRGAEAVIGLKAADDYSAVPFTKFEDLVNGTGWAYQFLNPDDGLNWWAECSVGFNGYRKSTGAAQFATAGHCAEELAAKNSDPFKLVQSSAGAQPTRGTRIGTANAADFHFGDGLDSGLVNVTTSLVPKPYVSTWGGGKGSPTAGTPVAVRGTARAIAGASMCRSGLTSGWACGSILAVDEHVEVSGFDVNTFISTACSLPGDSGGPAMVGNYALGVLSGGTADPSVGCKSDDVSAFFPMVSSDASILTQHTDWEPAVAVSAPTVADPSGVVFTGSGLEGTLPNGIPGDTVYLYLDGATTPSAQAAIAKGSTAFSFPLTGVSIGKHTYRIVAGWGVRTRSAAATGSVTLAPAPTVDRIAAPDRYTEAVAIANAGYPTTAKTVYVASGETFPDALSAAPAAAAQGGPLLLTAKNSLPASVKAKIVSLAPTRIVIVGGTGSVSAAVETTLSAIAHVKRYAGADRYAASRGLVDGAFGASGVNTLYLATGSNFPDALSAGAAAGSSGSAVLLVNGTKTSLDAATLALITKLHPAAIRIAGGPGSVSTGIEKSLAGKAASVKRLGGADRYAASQTINADAFTSASKIYVASGVVFPDALAGAVLAAKGAAPLYVTQTNCLSAGVIAGIARLGAGAVTLLGGTGSLTARVQALTSCTS